MRAPRGAASGAVFGTTRGYTELVVWQVAMELVVEVYTLVRRLPSEERFALCMQLRRAVVSVPANIAEGEGRGRARELAQHLRIARGSLAEVDTLIRIGVRLEYLSETEAEAASGLVIRTRQLLQRLLQYAEQRAREGANHQRPTPNALRPTNPP
jgi:four helix bundle protein